MRTQQFCFISANGIIREGSNLVFSYRDALPVYLLISCCFLRGPLSELNHHAISFYRFPFPTPSLIISSKDKCMAFDQVSQQPLE